jgi:hypothetical protein
MEFGCSFPAGIFTNFFAKKAKNRYPTMDGVEARFYNHIE